MKVKFGGLSSDDQQALESYQVTYQMAEWDLAALEKMNREQKNQIRFETDDDHVQWLRDQIQKGEPIEVIVVDEDGRILNGNHRLKAYLGMNGSRPDTIQVCVVTTKLSPRDREALQTRLNPTKAKNLSKDEQSLQIRREYESGFKVSDIAERLGVSKSLVDRVVTALNSEKTLNRFGIKENAKHAGIRQELARKGNSRIAVERVMRLEPEIDRGNLTVKDCEDLLKRSRKADSDEAVEALCKELEEEATAQKQRREKRSLTKARKRTEPTKGQVRSRIRAVTKIQTTTIRKYKGDGLEAELKLLQEWIDNANA